MIGQNRRVNNIRESEQRDKGEQSYFHETTPPKSLLLGMNPRAPAIKSI